MQVLLLRLVLTIIRFHAVSVRFHQEKVVVPVVVVEGTASPLFWLGMTLGSGNDIGLCSTSIAVVGVVLVQAFNHCGKANNH